MEFLFFFYYNQFFERSSKLSSKLMRGTSKENLQFFKDYKFYELFYLKTKGFMNNCKLR